MTANEEGITEHRVVRWYRAPWEPKDSLRYKAGVSGWRNLDAAGEATYLARSRANWIEFCASSDRDAERLLEKLILPDDPRPVWRRKEISRWLARFEILA